MVVGRDAGEMLSMISNVAEGFEVLTSLNPHAMLCRAVSRTHACWGARPIVSCSHELASLRGSEGGVSMEGVCVCVCVADGPLWGVGE